MPGKAKQYVDQSVTDVQQAVSSLREALGSVEKADNKTKIQSAISSLNAASEQLSNYQD